jgi:hypothetical protein
VTRRHKHLIVTLTEGDRGLSPSLWSFKINANCGGVGYVLAEECGHDFADAIERIAQVCALAQLEVGPR